MILEMQTATIFYMTYTYKSSDQMKIKTNTCTSINFFRKVQKIYSIEEKMPYLISIYFLSCFKRIDMVEQCSFMT